jgi:hypothetical protein
VNYSHIEIKRKGENISPNISPQRVIVHKKEVWHYVIDLASLGAGNDSYPRQRQGFEKGEEG